jgi:hypothetical protein
MSRRRRNGQPYCTSYSTSVAWVAPDGTWVDVPYSHIDTAVQLAKQLPGGADVPVKHRYAFVVAAGYVAVGNVGTYAAYSGRSWTPAVRAAVLERVLGCARKRQLPRDPEDEQAVLIEYVEGGWFDQERGYGELRVEQFSYASFARWLGGRKGEDALFDALLAA